MRLEIGSIRCVVDVEATRRIFTQLAIGSAEQCSCIYCRNYAVVRERAFPAPLRSALESAGIDWRKESEAVHYGLEPGIGHLYQAWINFMGFVENGDLYVMASDHDAKLTVQIRAYNDAEHYTPKSELFAGGAVGRIDVMTNLPWLLDEPDPELIRLT